MARWNYKGFFYQVFIWEPNLNSFTHLFMKCQKFTEIYSDKEISIVTQMIGVSKLKKE